MEESELFKPRIEERTDTENTEVIDGMTPPPYISASLIGGYIACPFRWAMGHFHGRNGTFENARWGTDFHNLIERIDDLDREHLAKEVENTFGDESESVYDSLVDIRHSDEILGLKRLGRETKFELYMPHPDVTLIGHIDDLLESEDGSTLIIRDYKTSLHYEPAVVWSNRIQPRCYNYAVRLLYPLYKNYKFQICYPRQNKTVEWDLEPETSSFESYIKTVWNDMKTSYAKGWAEREPTRYFLPVLNPGCSHCPVKDACEVYQNLVNLKEIPQVYQESIPRRYGRLYSLNKAIYAEMETMKQDIIDRFSKGEKTIIDDCQIFRMQSRVATFYSAGDVMEKIREQNFVPDQEIDFDMLFDVSTAGMRKIIERHPELAAVFESCRQTRNGAPFLVYGGEKK